MNATLALTSGKCDRQVKPCKHFTVLCSCAKCGIIRLVCSTICWTVYVTTCYISLQYQSKTNLCCFFFREKLIDQRIWALALKRFGLILSTGMRKTKGVHFWAFNSFHRFSVGLRSGAWPLHHIEILLTEPLLTYSGFGFKVVVKLKDVAMTHKNYRLLLSLFLGEL